jgi:hypothetical protein
MVLIYCLPDSDIFFYRDPVWTDDEGICCRNVNNELHFFEDNNFGQLLFILMHPLCNTCYHCLLFTAKSAPTPKNKF